MSGNPWTAAELSTLVAMWTAGAPVADIVKVLGRTAKSIEEKRKRECLPIRDPGPPWDQASDDLLRELWEAGVGSKQIAHRLGRTPAAVTNRRFFLRLEPRNIVQPPARAWTDHENATFCGLWAAGCSVNHIAETMDRSRGSILVRRIFLKLPKRKGTDGANRRHLDARTA